MRKKNKFFEIKKKNREDHIENKWISTIKWLVYENLITLVPYTDRLNET